MSTETLAVDARVLRFLVTEARTELRQAAHKGEYSDYGSGKWAALWRLDLVSDEEYRSLLNERSFLIRRFHDRARGAA